MSGWWWLSFVGDDGFLGVIVMDGETFEAAWLNTIAAEINPGGEVQGWEIPPEHVPAEFWQRRLLTRDETEQVQDETEGSR